jgi:hypothetical protein
MAYEESGRINDALPLYEETLTQRQATLGPGHPDTLLSMENLARVCLDVNPARAEQLLRRTLTIREKGQPPDWRAWNTRSLLGASLLAQKKYTESEPLLTSAYEGIKDRQSKIPAPFRHNVAQAGVRIVQLYDQWGKKDRADHWRRHLAAAKGSMSEAK